jgi:hypothetical protein
MIRGCGLVSVPGILLLILFTSCAPRRAEVELDTAAVSATRLLGLVREQTGRLQTLSGRGSMTFESPEAGGTASFEVALRKPDSLLAQFEGPFGVDIGSLFLSGERFLVYNSQENVVITGRPGTTPLRNLIPFDISFEELISAFTGSFRLPDVSTPVETYRIDDNRFLVVARCEDRLCYYWIDNEYLQVSACEIRDSGDELLMRASSSGFVEEGEASINPPDPSFVYSIPEDARSYER